MADFIFADGSRLSGDIPLSAAFTKVALPAGGVGMDLAGERGALTGDDIPDLSAIYDAAGAAAAAEAAANAYTDSAVLGVATTEVENFNTGKARGDIFVGLGGSDVDVIAAGALDTVLTGQGTGNLPIYAKITDARVDAAAAIAFTKLEGGSTHTAAKVLASPAGATGALSVRALVAGDIPDLSATYQPKDADLTLLAGITVAANQFIARSSSGAVAAKAITDFGLSLVDDADAAAARTTLGLVIGTNVQAYDADLAAIAGLTSAADKGIMFTGAGTAATYPLTPAALSVLDDTTVAAMLTTLGGASLGAANTFAADNRFNALIAQGAAPVSSVACYLALDAVTAGTTQSGLNMDVRFSSGATLLGRALTARVRLPAAAFTMTEAIACQLTNAVIGSGAAITTQIGLDIAALSGATTNIAIRTGANPCRFGGTGIFGTTSAANAAAVLQADSITQGFLPPRMTTTQRDAISSPPEGLEIYNTTTHKKNIRTASAWEVVTSA